MSVHKQLSEKAVAVLSRIADGHSYSQIVDGQPGITYLDICAAAAEALRLNESQSDYQVRMEQIKSRHPRAYERWDTEEDQKLAGLHHAGESASAIAQSLGRQPSAIRSRLGKLGLLPANRTVKRR